MSIIGGLELKFVLHHGGYIVQTVAGHQELLGPDVTISLAPAVEHHVAELIDRSAYALVTESAEAQLDRPLERQSRSPSSTSITHPCGRVLTAAPASVQAQLAVPLTAGSSSSMVTEEMDEHAERRNYVLLLIPNDQGACSSAGGCWLLDEQCESWRPGRMRRGGSIRGFSSPQ
jgi:hypothetical protein